MHGGETNYSCAIVTTEPNELIGPIHNRMPVLIGVKNWPKWLGEELAKNCASEAKSNTTGLAFRQRARSDPNAPV